MSNQSLPSYIEFLKQSWQFIAQNYVWMKQNYDFPSHTIRDLKEFGKGIYFTDLISIIFVAILLTAIKNFASLYVIKPIGSHLGLKHKDQVRFSENGWKLVIGGMTYSVIIYTLFSGTNYFYQPQLIWINHSIDEVIPLNIRSIIIVELGMYIHDIHDLIFQNVWRKDMFMDILHHSISIILLYFTLVTKIHKMCILSMFLFNNADLLMGAWKTALLFKLGGFYGKLLNALKVFLLFVTVVTFSMCRLYWYPLKAMFSIVDSENQNKPDFPFSLIQYALSWIIIIMSAYWIMLLMFALVHSLWSNKYVDPREFSDSPEELDESLKED